MKQYLLGLDAGTTSFKGALFDTNRKMVASIQRDYVLLTPQESIVEFPVENYWHTLCEIIRELLDHARVSGDKVLSLALSSQGETLICLDEDGNSIGNAIVWLDNRAVTEARSLKKRFGMERIYSVSGQADMLATWPAAKILWLRNNRSKDFARTKTFMLLEDYLLYRLTGKRSGEPNLWASSAMLNIHSSQWWPEMLDVLNITPKHLPNIVSCGTALGNITEAAAARTGLSSKTVAVMGALDQTCNAIGCGLTKPGMVFETTGSCLAVSAVLDGFIPYDAHMPVTCQNHAVPGRYTVLLWSQSAGMTLKWFADNFYPDCPELDDAFAKINLEAASVSMGCEGLTMLPHLTGAANPEYDAFARGVFSGVTLEHGRGHFARSILEAVACMLRRNLEQLDAIGAGSDSIFCLGGGANSRIWLQIKADVTQTTMMPLRAQESACLGAAILAGIGVGVYDSVDWKPLEETKTICVPDSTQKVVCDELYRRYIALYDSLKQHFAVNSRKRGCDSNAS